jgi:hypothetical protein
MMSVTMMIVAVLNVAMTTRRRHPD